MTGEPTGAPRTYDLLTPGGHLRPDDDQLVEDTEFRAALAGAQLVVWLHFASDLHRGP